MCEVKATLLLKSLSQTQRIVLTPKSSLKPYYVVNIVISVTAYFYYNSVLIEDYFIILLSQNRLEAENL